MGSSSASDAPAYQLSIVIRVIGESYLMTMVVRDIWLAPGDPTSADLDPIEDGGGVPDPDLDEVADLGHHYV